MNRKSDQKSSPTISNNSMIESKIDNIRSEIDKNISIKALKTLTSKSKNSDLEVKLLKAQNDRLKEDLLLKQSHINETESSCLDRVNAVVSSFNADNAENLEMTNALISEKQNLKLAKKELEDYKQKAEAKIMSLSLNLDKSKEELAEYQSTIEQLSHQIKDSYILQENAQPLNLSQNMCGPTFGKLSEIEVENVRLRAKLLQRDKDYSEYLQLKEDHISLQQKLESYEKWKSRALAAENELEEADGSSNQQRIENLEQELKRLRAENEVTLCAKGESDALCTSLQAQISALDAKTKASIAKRDVLSSMNKLLEEKFKAQSTQLKVTSAEAEMYKSLSKNILEAENPDIPYRELLLDGLREAVNDTAEMCNEINDALADIDFKVNDALVSVEENCTRLNNLDASIVEQMTATDSMNERTEKLINNLKEELASTQEELLKVTEEKENLIQEKENAQFTGLQDEQVLHLVDNPKSKVIAMRVDELDRIRKENERLRQRCLLLKERIDRLVDAKADSRSEKHLKNEVNITQMMDDENRKGENPFKEIADLKKQLQLSELRFQRSMEVFQDCSNALHQAILLLFGCRIDLKAPGLYRICLINPETKTISKEETITFKFKLDAEAKPWSLPNDGSPLLRFIDENILNRSQNENFVPHLLTTIFKNYFEACGCVKENDTMLDTMMM